ncbi:MAG: putative chitobiose transport system substrate-binding protein [Chloroflexota bacterium]|nr:putative chitobiose transport system substrate-binding protein [Chloroflexota bacterium]MEA2605335.1 putative chitobiose transport system substrate-binding protein [Chloroflexota bacterium]
MKLKRTLTMALATSLLFVACSSSASPSPTGTPAASTPATSTAPASAGTSTAPAASASAAPLAADPAEAVIPNVEQGAEIHFWTFYLSPTFDNYIKATIARFEATYPGVKVDWEDHQGTFKDDLNSAFAANIAPDVINLSVSEGWVSEYASKNLLLNLDDKVPQAVKDIYFPGLWKEQLIDGKNYQFPWYQGLNIELINKRLFEKAGIDPAAFPKTIDGLPQLCQTLKDKAGTVCDIRLTVSDLIAQMVYEGGVKPISADGKTFTFDSPEAVAWLQMYVDMVKAGTVDNTTLTTTDDRTGLLLFSAGQAPFYATGPNLIRDVKSNNAQLYADLATAPSPLGKSGVTGKGLMSISVKGDTKFPNASMALAQYFTNPRAMVEFAKIVSVYPSSAEAFKDPFFASAPAAIEDSARPLAGGIISTYADIVPTIPKKADVNDIVLKAIESALFGDTPVPAQQALTDAVAKANALLK